MSPQTTASHLTVPARPAHPTRNDTSYSKFSVVSVPPEGSILTGKQEHCTPFSSRHILPEATKQTCRPQA